MEREQEKTGEIRLLTRSRRQRGENGRVVDIRRKENKKQKKHRDTALLPHSKEAAKHQRIEGIPRGRISGSGKATKGRRTEKKKDANSIRLN